MKSLSSCGLLALLLLSLALTAGSAAEPDAASIPGGDPSLWPEAQRAFLQDGPGLLLTAEQRTELRSLDEAGRDRFIQDFLDKDPIPETKANELREGIERRARLADSQFPWPSDVRWQLVFLNGLPADRLVIDCGESYKPSEVWSYRFGVDAQTGKAREHGLVIYRPGVGEPFRLWLPIDAKRVLYIPEMEYWLEQWEELRGQIQAERFDLQVCKQATQKIDKATGVPGLTGARAGYGYNIKPVDSSSYLAPPKDLAKWAREAAATPVQPAPPAVDVKAFELRYPERQGQRLRTRALVQIDPHGLTSVEEEGKTAYTLSVQGTIEQNGKPFDELRMRYRLPVPAPGEPLVLAADWSLRPGKPFLMRLVIKDEQASGETRLTRAFTVPEEPTPDPVAVNVPNGDLVPATVRKGKDSVILMPPPQDVVLGLWRAEALVSGDRIKKVVFSVDGTAQLTRTSPPFSAEVRLSHFPTEQVVRAEGYDEKGQLVAADEVILNQPRGVLGVWIVDPPKGSKVSGSKVRARAEVGVPDGRRLDKVEFKLNDALVTTLTKPPWQADLQMPGDDLVYVTVVATLDDGTRTEAVRFLRSPQYLEEVDVNLVELYVAVTDHGGQLVEGLGKDDFDIFESGKHQELSKFELVQNMPLTVGILLDTSGSMASSLAQAEHAAAGFLKRVMKPKDKAFAVSFAGRPRLDMPMTDDIEAVAHSISDLQAVGETALFDALIQSLYYHRGVQGQRALVLLSDGDDNSSYFKFQDAVDYAQRSGVAIYAIGYNISALPGGIHGKLKELTEKTGGRLFLAGKAADLPAIYEQIERELRSRYLLAYNATLPMGPGGWRDVEVKVKKGYKARATRSYTQ